MVHIYLIVGFSEICKELQQVQAMLLEHYLEEPYKPDRRVCYQKAEEAYSTGGSAMDKSKKEEHWMDASVLHSNGEQDQRDTRGAMECDEHVHC